MWMSESDIGIFCITVGRNNPNRRETKKQCAWFFSGEGGRKEYIAGVTLVMSNKCMQYVGDVGP